MSKVFPYHYDQELYHNIGAGLDPRYTPVHKFGAVDSVGTSWVPLTQSQTWQTPTTAQALEIVSTNNTDDIPTGTGARTVRVYGIQDWSVGEVSVDVALNGTTPVAISGTWLRIHRVKVVDSGTYGSATASSHNSTITVQGSGAGVVWGTINSLSGIGLGQSEIGCYAVGAGKTITIQEMEVYVDSTKTADLLFFVRENADTVAAPYSGMQVKVSLRSVEGYLSKTHVTPLGPFYGPCDVGWLVRSTSTTSTVEASFEMIIEDS